MKIIRSKSHAVQWKVLEFLYRLTVGLSMSVFSRIDYGTNVYECDWDVLVVLDTARVDAMRQVAPKFDFIEDVESIRSIGSTSSEWIAKTFTTEHQAKISDTVLVSANPHVQHTLYDRKFPEHDKEAFFSWTSWNTVTPEEFAHIDQPWQYATDEKYDHVLPGKITERAVALHRKHQPRKMIVHYMQPHRPHMAQAAAAGRNLTAAERDPFTFLKNGGERQEVYDNHVADLEFVLEKGVKPLLRNIDAEKVVLTADHGDGFGENWCYAHVAGDPRRQVRRVPWVETTATDQGKLEPELTPPKTVDKKTVDHLKALGYT